MEALGAAGDLTIERPGADRYGRTIGVVYADGVNLSCLQVENGHAVYQWRYGGRVRADCPSVPE